MTGHLGGAPAGLLVGHGSIGRHHLSVLDRRYEQVAVVDQRPESRDAATEAVPHATVSADLDGLEPWPWAATTAVVATWGPSHVSIVQDLVDRGVRRILVEKPLATSVADAHTIGELAERTQARIGVHLHYRYSGVVEALQRLARDAELGEPQQIVVHGGARCLVTNGIHYLDLATALFGGAPHRVTSTATGEPINPRSPDVEFYGGTAVWSYGGGREAVISFPNTSTLYEALDIYYRHGVIELSVFLDAVVRRRPPVDPEQAVTRSGAASEELHRGPLPDVKELGAATARILDELEAGTPPVLPLSESVAGIGAMVGALQAGRSRCAVDLPIDPTSAAGTTEWPMS